MTPQGYAVGPESTETHHIFYELPETVEEGYVEFEVSGLELSASDDDTDFGFMAMYDGRGIKEGLFIEDDRPWLYEAVYSTDYQSNFYRWNVHWRGDRGVMNSVVNLAADTPERNEAEFAVFDQDNRDFVVEPDGKPFEFRPDRWHKVRVEWSNRHHRVYIDGQPVWYAYSQAEYTTDYMRDKPLPYSYAPQIHRIWLGAAPGKYKNWPNAVYRNLKVVSYH